VISLGRSRRYLVEPSHWPRRCGSLVISVSLWVFLCMRRMGSHGPWTQRASSMSCSLQRGPLSTAGLGSAQQLRERSAGPVRMDCLPLLGAFRAHWNMPFMGEIRGSVSQPVLCRKEQQSRIHTLAHTHGRPNGPSDIQREQLFLLRVALKPTTRVLYCLHILVAASGEPSVFQRTAPGGRLLPNTKAVLPCD
jgi:hypothetical protein